MLVNIAVGFTGIIFFLFIFWKRLKEDYSSEIIFRSSFAIVAGILVGWVVSLRTFQALFLWLSALGAFVGLIYANSRFKIRFYESLEAVVIGGLPWISLIFLQNSVQTSSLISFIAFLITLILIFVYYYLDQHYKEFTWYRSGKIGFSGLSTLLLIFAIRLVVAILGVPVISFSSYEIWLSAVFLIVTVVLIFNLGRRKI